MYNLDKLILYFLLDVIIIYLLYLLFKVIKKCINCIKENNRQTNIEVVIAYPVEFI